jgi:hypothetical protein
MKRNLDPETENLLKSVAPKTAPEGLRERLLGAAARSPATDSAATPLLRMCLAGCAVILIVVSLADSFASKNELNRLRAMLGTPISNHAGSPPISPAEDFADPLLIKLEANRRLLFADGKGKRRTYREVLRMEKQILREEFNGN